MTKAERYRVAIALHSLGFRYVEIAEEFGVSVPRAYQIVSAAYEAAGLPMPKRNRP